ncbi:MAG TPA: hypothetical protein ENH12_04665, partial [Proteobacteria bacterium]|nr:hypothetical protein [Pseudomonadota bacterium]
RNQIPRIIPYQTAFFDTTFSASIKAGNREALLIQTLNYFSSFDGVITDRYHGVIFSVICRRPCLVLPTVDHKLTSAIEWFTEVPFITIARNLDEIPGKLEQCLRGGDRSVPDWNRIYFDGLPARLGLKLAPTELT